MNSIALSTSKGLRIKVTRMANDCTSASHEYLTVVAITHRHDAGLTELDTEFQHHTPTKDAPAVAVEIYNRTTITGKASGTYLSIQPLELDDFTLIRLDKPGHMHPANGGNTATSDELGWLLLTDELGADSPVVAIHDRFETTAEYNAMI